MTSADRRTPAVTRAIVSIVVAAILIGLTVAAMSSWAIWSAREDAWREAAITSQSLAMSLARTVESNINAYDRSLLDVARAVAAPPGEAANRGPSEAAFRQTLLDTLTVDPDLGPIAIANEQGEVVAATRAAGAPVDSIGGAGAMGSNVLGADFFAEAWHNPHPGLIVSQPQRSVVDGGWSMVFARRLSRPDGTFEGVVMATLPLRHFNELTDALVVGRHSTVTLLREDGIVLARTPYEPTLIGRDARVPLLARRAGLQGDAADLPEGSGEARDRNLSSYSRVGSLPLVVTASLSAGEVYAEWRRHAAVIGGMTGALLVILFCGTVTLCQELRRRIAAEAQAQQNADNYRVLADNSSDVILRLDRDGTQRYVSSSVTELLGYEPRALLGRDWQLVAAPEDRPMLVTALAALTPEQGHASVTYRCRHRDGHSLWVEASLRLVRETVGPGPHGERTSDVIVNIRDVTGRKQSEEEHAAIAQQLAVLAATDGLTGLANRRTFDETLGREWRRACRSETPLGLLMIDADCFKAFNDRYGHQRGDAALQAIAACIAKAIKRPGDLAARYGGEEFAVILPGSTQPGALSVANDVRKRLASLAVPHADSPTGLLTISVGVASTIAQPDRNPADLLAAADAALYAAKHAGRDRAFCQGVSFVSPAAE